ncbi:MAG: glycosyltransferase, partial [Kiritimatiellae bacterium]|nr:glycosyltransferase [Kiritimatiellia bacterium]
LECARLDIRGERGYFNSGVLVMDLPTWRRKQIPEQAIDYLARHHGDPKRCGYADQDALNVVMQADWMALDETWNFNIYHCVRGFGTLTPARRETLRQGPAIVHYASDRKPWTRRYFLPFQREFLAQARRRGIRYPLEPFGQPLSAWRREWREFRALRARYRRGGVRVKGVL